jgi:hypothetical protein
MRRRPAARSVAQQAFALRARYPGAQLHLRAGRLLWTGDLRPNCLSRDYRVQIAYRTGGHPHVRVNSPQLDGRPGESLPHVYRDGTLCLYREGEWSSSMLIADSVVPWASEWLFFYEIWLPSGEWHGGGEWPPPRASDFKDSVVAVGRAQRRRAG